MALLERLQILVDGNASGAIREFQKVGAAADRELGRTEDKLLKISNQLTSFGTGLLAGSAVAAVGLSKLATAASDYGEAVNKATVILGGESVKQLEDFAGAASKTAGISKTAALDAAAGFGALGKQAGLTGEPLAKFSTDLVQLAGDLASFNNTTVDESLQALKSGLQGETEPLKRFNIFLNDAALKQEFFALTGEKVTGVLTQQQKVVAANSLIFKQASDATGDFERTSDSLANQQRTLQAEFENVKTQLGEGLVPVFSTIIGSVGKVTSAFAELSPESQKTAGSIAGIGVTATGIVGALSIVAGQGLKLREVLTTVGTDGSRSLNRLGVAAKGIAIAGVGIASFLALDSVLRDLTQSTADLEQTTNRLIAAQSNEAALDALIEKTRQLDGFYEDFVETIGPGLSEQININGVTVDLGDLGEALQSISGDTGQLEKALIALESARIEEALIGGSPLALESYNAIIADFRSKLADAKAAQDATGQSSGALEIGLEGVGEATTEATFRIEGLTVKTEEGKDAFLAYADALRASTDPFFAVISATTQLDEAQAKVVETFGALADGATPDELLAFAEAQRGAVQAGIGLEAAIATLRGEVEAGNITYDQAIATLDTLATKYPQLLGPIGQVKGEFFLAALAAQGLKDKAPIDIPVATDADEATRKLQGVQAALQVIATTTQLVANAVRVAQGVQQQVAAESRTDIGFQEVVGNRDLNGNGIIGRQFGGPVRPDRTYLVGEVGPELFVPKTSGTIVPNNELQGGTVNLTQNITTGDPILTAAEVVRRQRDAEFLAGV
jgi:hypothetical protein